MLTAETKKLIAKTLRIKDEDFENALTATTEVPLTIAGNLTVLDDVELQRVKNTEYTSGKEKGVEIAVKDVKEKLAVDFQGKTIEGLVEAAQKKAIADAKINPDEKVVTLTKDIEILRATNATLLQTVTTKELEAGKYQVDKELFKELPSLGDNAPDVDTVLTLMRAKGTDFKIENGVLVAFNKDGVIKDNTAKEVPAKDVILNFAKESKLITDVTKPIGRGAGDGNKAPVFSKLSELEAHYKGQGKSTNGAEFMDQAQALKKENKDFDLSS